MQHHHLPARLATLAVILAATSTGYADSKPAPAAPTATAPAATAEAATSDGFVVPPVIAVPADIREEYKLSDFYKKCVLIRRFPIVASDKVRDEALREAAYLVLRMTSRKPEILDAMAKSKVRLTIMGYQEMTTDIPEHAFLKNTKEGKEYWDRRARGLGATPTAPAVSCGEENVLNFKGDPYSTENILIHEFSHAMHEMGLNTVDPTFDRRLKEAYQAAIKDGLWKDTYASRNRHEYWAEIVQSWFTCNRVNDSEHGQVNSPQQVREHDPRGAALLVEIFGDEPWKWVRAEDRWNEPHLATLDRKTLPRYQWPEHTRKVKITPQNKPQQAKGEKKPEDASSQGKDQAKPKAESKQP